MIHNQHPEILIDWFDNFGEENEYEFLSNFYQGAPFVYKETYFDNSEQAFVYEKIDPNHEDAAALRELVVATTDPGSAKSLGRRVPLRPDWDVVKFSIMRELVHAKFSQNPEAKKKLLDTRDAYLQEGTYWGDEIWGVDITASTDPMKRPGWNMLGSILMETRALLLAEGAL